MQQYFVDISLFRMRIDIIGEDGSVQSQRLDSCFRRMIALYKSSSSSSSSSDSDSSSSSSCCKSMQLAHLGYILVFIVFVVKENTNKSNDKQTTMITTIPTTALEK